MAFRKNQTCFDINRIFSHLSIFCETLEILVEDLSWHNEEYLWFPEVSVYLFPCKNYISIIIIIRNCLASIEMFGSASIIEPTVFSFKFGYWHRPCCHIYILPHELCKLCFEGSFFLINWPRN